MKNAMSSRMIRMLKWVRDNGTNKRELKSANQVTLRGLAMRGLIKTNGLTKRGEHVIDEYDSSEFIGRKVEGRDLSDGVKLAMNLVKYRVMRKK